MAATWQSNVYEGAGKNWRSFASDHPIVSPGGPTGRARSSSEK
jgi:hypothetical protein